MNPYKDVLSFIADKFRSAELKEFMRCYKKLESVVELKIKDRTIDKLVAQTLLTDIKTAMNLWQQIDFEKLDIQDYDLLRSLIGEYIEYLHSSIDEDTSDINQLIEEKNDQQSKAD